MPNAGRFITDRPPEGEGCAKPEAWRVGFQARDSNPRICDTEGPNPNDCLVHKKGDSRRYHRSGENPLDPTTLIPNERGWSKERFSLRKNLRKMSPMDDCVFSNMLFFFVFLSLDPMDVDRGLRFSKAAGKI